MRKQLKNFFEIVSIGVTAVAVVATAFGGFGIFVDGSKILWLTFAGGLIALGAASGLWGACRDPKSTAVTEDYSVTIPDESPVGWYIAGAIATLLGVAIVWGLIAFP